MLSFSRKADGGGSPADLAELLDRTVMLAGSDYDLKKCRDFRQIEIVREYEPGLTPVVCQAGKIQQVFLNILRNGAEAMMAIKDLGRTPRFVLRVAQDQGMVRVEIEDNGPGMDEATRRRVFEPFFTTKSGGAGIGLAVVAEIMQAHGGFVVLDNSASGASLRLLFPMTRQKGAAK